MGPGGLSVVELSRRAVMAAKVKVKRDHVVNTCLNFVPVDLLTSPDKHNSGSKSIANVQRSD